MQEERSTSADVLAPLLPTSWEEPHPLVSPAPTRDHPSMWVGSGSWKPRGGREEGAGAGFLAPPQAINLSPSLAPQPSWKEETAFSPLHSLALAPPPPLMLLMPVTNKLLVAKFCVPFHTLPHSLKSKIVLSTISSWKLPHPCSSQKPEGPMPVFREFRHLHQPGPLWHQMQLHCICFFKPAPPESPVMANCTIIHVVILARNLGGGLVSFLSPSCPPRLVVFTLQSSLFWRASVTSPAAQQEASPSSHQALSHSVSEDSLGDIFQLVSLPSVPQLLSTLHLESQTRPRHQLLAVHCLEEKAQVLLHSIQGALLRSCSF